MYHVVLRLMVNLIRFLSHIHVRLYASIYMHRGIYVYVEKCACMQCVRNTCSIEFVLVVEGTVDCQEINTTSLHNQKVCMF